MKKLLKNLPQTSGIYKMKDKTGVVIYVGKAKNLKKRVSSYFQQDYIHSTRSKKLVESIADIEIIQTDSELEALILENNLIQKLRPKYNILMKDDKSYVYIRIDLKEAFPKISIIRAKEIEGHNLKDTKDIKFFGPKLSSSKVQETLRFIKKLFAFRSCKLDIEWIDNKDIHKISGVSHEDCVKVKNRVIRYPCLEYSIKQCPGPCIGTITPDEYKKNVQRIMAFLGGKTDEIERDLKQQMMAAAEKKLFEKASRIKNKLLTIQQITERQKITDINRENTDVINYVTHLGKIYFNVILIRFGKMIDQENFIVDALELEQNDNLGIKEALSAFLYQYYEKASDMPKEILLPQELDGIETLEKWLSEQKGEKISLIAPKRGEKNKLLELSLKNATNFANQYRIKWMARQASEKALEQLAQLLDIKTDKLKRIEGYDISHLSGDNTVGSMVVFENGVAKPEDYRHFKMRTVKGKPDDYTSLEEVLTRRLKYLQKPEKLTVKKAAKKYAPAIQQWGKNAKWKELYKTPDFQNFHLLFKEKQVIGMVRLLEPEKDIFEFSALYIAPKYRGQHFSFVLLEKLIKKNGSKKARFYIGGEGKLINYYTNFGFIPVRQAPKTVEESNKKWGDIDGVTYTILAYYKAQKQKNDPSFTAKPDIIVIDGGKGQLGVAVKCLEKIRFSTHVVSLAKRLEEIFVPGKKDPIVLEKGDEVLKLLQRVRDESHRFAITYQRALHRKNMI